MSEKPQKTRGRKPLFQEGATPQQELVALLLALGRGPFEIAKKQKIAYETVYTWQQHPYFQELVEKFRKENIEQIKKEGFDELEALTNIAIQGKTAPIHTSDRIRAIENLLKVKGMYSPEQREVKIKDELKRLSDKELEQLGTEALSIDVSNTTTTDTRGNTTP